MFCWSLWCNHPDCSVWWSLLLTMWHAHNGIHRPAQRGWRCDTGMQCRKTSGRARMAMWHIHVLAYIVRLSEDGDVTHACIGVHRPVQRGWRWATCTHCRTTSGRAWMAMWHIHVLAYIVRLSGDGDVTHARIAAQRLAERGWRCDTYMYWGTSSGSARMAMLHIHVLAYIVWLSEDGDVTHTCIDIHRLAERGWRCDRYMYWHTSSGSARMAMWHIHVLAYIVWLGENGDVTHTCIGIHRPAQRGWRCDTCTHCRTTSGRARMAMWHIHVLGYIVWLSEDGDVTHTCIGIYRLAQRGWRCDRYMYWHISSGSARMAMWHIHVLAYIVWLSEDGDVTDTCIGIYRLAQRGWRRCDTYMYWGTSSGRARMAMWHIHVLAYIVWQSKDGDVTDTCIGIHRQAERGWRCDIYMYWHISSGRARMAMWHIHVLAYIVWQSEDGDVTDTCIGIYRLAQRGWRCDTYMYWGTSSGRARMAMWQIHVLAYIVRQSEDGDVTYTCIGIYRLAQRGWRCDTYMYWHISSGRARMAMWQIHVLAYIVWLSEAGDVTPTCIGVHRVAERGWRCDIYMYWHISSGRARMAMWQIHVLAYIVRQSEDGDVTYTCIGIYRLAQRGWRCDTYMYWHISSGRARMAMWQIHVLAYIVWLSEAGDVTPTCIGVHRVAERGWRCDIYMYWHISSGRARMAMWHIHVLAYIVWQSKDGDVTDTCIGIYRLAQRGWRCDTYMYWGTSSGRARMAMWHIHVLAYIVWLSEDGDVTHTCIGIYRLAERGWRCDRYMYWHISSGSARLAMWHIHVLGYIVWQSEDGDVTHICIGIYRLAQRGWRCDTYMYWHISSGSARMAMWHMHVLAYIVWQSEDGDVTHTCIGIYRLAEWGWRCDTYMYWHISSGSVRMAKWHIHVLAYIVWLSDDGDLTHTCIGIYRLAERGWRCDTYMYWGTSSGRERITMWHIHVLAYIVWLSEDGDVTHTCIGIYRLAQRGWRCDTYMYWHISSGSARMAMWHMHVLANIAGWGGMAMWHMHVLAYIAWLSEDGDLTYACI